VGRYGGEEFLIVLPNCEKEDIQACGERIRSTICGKPVQVAGFALPVTASLGAVAALFPLHTEEASLTAADTALYRAKNTGRNRVVLREVDAVEAANTLVASPPEPALYIC
jgi:diguanylate cyclase